MTFYQELQLNQAGSKNLLKKSETVSYTHLDVYKRQIYDNPVGVLTNNPPFPQQMFQLNNYMYLSPKQPRNTFCENLRCV